MLSNKKTIILDSINRNNDPLNNSLSWNITTVASANNYLSGRVLVEEELTCIEKVVISSMDFPVSPLLEPIYDTIRCYLEFIPSITYFGDFENHFIPFHFTLKLKYDKKCNRLHLKPINNTIVFDKKLNNLQTIQVKFYNPYSEYIFPKDNTTATLTAGPLLYPLYTMFTVDPAFLKSINTGEPINIVTDINSLSQAYNNELDSKNLHNIIKINATQFIIYTENLIPPFYTQANVQIYYATNRFSIALDMYYKK